MLPIITAILELQLYKKNCVRGRGTKMIVSVVLMLVFSLSHNIYSLFYVKHRLQSIVSKDISLDNALQQKNDSICILLLHTIKKSTYPTKHSGRCIVFTSTFLLCKFLVPYGAPSYIFIHWLSIYNKSHTPINKQFPHCGA